MYQLVVTGSCDQMKDLFLNLSAVVLCRSQVLARQPVKWYYKPRLRLIRPISKGESVLNKSDFIFNFSMPANLLL